MVKEFKNKNLVAKITESRGKFNVFIDQISNTGLEEARDYFHSKMSISTYNRAEKWALNNINK